MDSGHVTTPFGRRSMTFALLARQQQASEAKAETKRNKWKLFRAICEAREELDISDRSLTVLDALLSFYPSDELSATNDLIVFPSNTQLSIRARGMTAATLRRHLAALVDAGLILRKDSANGKRFARRSRVGEISEAFGFNLAPLLARAREIEGIAARIAADREYFHATRERINLCRRDITKLIQLALDSSVEGEWSQFNDRFRTFLAALPRRPSLDELQFLLGRLVELRTTIIKLLDSHDKTQKMCAKESQIERHIQDSQTYSQFESEIADERVSETLCSGATIAAKANETSEINSPSQTNHIISTRPNTSLDTVLRACPEITNYGPGGSIRSWRDLVSACALLGPMLQISASAFRDACRVMGPENTAIVIACMYGRGGQINSAGAYLRDLSRRAARGQFTVTPMLSARLRFLAAHYE